MPQLKISRMLQGRSNKAKEITFFKREKHFKESISKCGKWLYLWLRRWEEAPKNFRVLYSLKNQTSSGPVDQLHTAPSSPYSSTLMAHQLGGLDSPPQESACILQLIFSRGDTFTIQFKLFLQFHPLNSLWLQKSKMLFRPLSLAIGTPRHAYTLLFLPLSKILFPNRSKSPSEILEQRCWVEFLNSQNCHFKFIFVPIYK